MRKLGLWHRIKLALPVAAIAGFGLAPAIAQTNCANTALATLSSGTTVTASAVYDPFGGTAVNTNMTVTVRNTNNSNCSIAVVFVRTTSPIVMSNGAFSLTYGLDFNGANAMNIGTPSSGWFTTVGANTTANFNTFRMTIAANQTAAAAGSYSDSQVSLYLYARSGGTWQLVRTYPFTFNATINKRCTMAAPSPATLNFTSAITSGRPNAGVILSSLLGSINCTFPSRITLAGSAMQRTPTIGTVAGFDNFINWRATATFGSANVTLDTSSLSTVTSSAYNVPSGTTINGSFNANVNMITGQSLRSGTYTGTLTVTVDPNL